MPPSQDEILLARLTRMKYLIDALEAACGESKDLQEIFVKLKHEMEAARASLRPLST
jgi:hypothetical protein